MARLLLAAAAALLLATTAAHAQKVHVELYAEALCPYCAKFLEERLAPMFKNGVQQLTWLDYIPYGNARWDPESAGPTCQHGDKECRFNRMLSCAMANYPMQDDWFPFVACLEKYAAVDGHEDVANGTQACAVRAGLLSSRLLDCYNGPLGDTLQRLAKQRTDSLKPPHQYVPWVVVNGIPIGDDYDNLQTYICAAFANQRARPAVCFQPPAAPPSTAPSSISAPRRAKGMLAQAAAAVEQALGALLPRAA